MPPLILLAPDLQPEAREVVRQHFPVADLTGYDRPDSVPGLTVTDIRGMVTRGESIVGPDLMDALPNLEIISNYGAGYDGIDMAAAAERGIMVVHTPDAITEDTATLALALALDVTRRVTESDRFVRAGKWLKGVMPLTTSIRGKTAGIVGLGRVGKALARRLEVCDMRIAYHNRTPVDGVDYPYYGDPVALATASDLLFVCCIGGAGTFHLVDAKVLAALGPKGYVFNTSRGTIIDGTALVDSLERGVIAGAGLDVFETEPEMPASLLAMDNVVLTPHMGSGTLETRQRMGEVVLENLIRHFGGEPVLSPVPELADKVR